MLDFSGLTDDQLIELARGCCMEAARRSPATESAMRAMMIDEAERIRIARTATELEIAAQRARERERIANETATKLRAAESQRIAAEIAQQTREKQHKRNQEHAGVLRRVADAMGGIDPSTIGLLIADTRFGRRAMINEAGNRYARTHIVDCNLQTNEIKTIRAHVPHKPKLSALLKELADGEYFNYPSLWIAGDAIDWSAA